MKLSHVAIPLLLVIVALPLFGQPAVPPRPAKYRAVLRYDIPALRALHIQQYDALVADLKRLGFEFQPPLDDQPLENREDPSVNTFRGLIPSLNAGALAQTPNVATVQLIPEALTLPDELDKSVRVRIELAGGFTPERQRQLAEQTETLLMAMGFKGAIGYDRHGYGGRPYTRLEGTLPTGRLDLLLRDLRRYPMGWLAPLIPPSELPAPLRNVSPIILTEVLDVEEPRFLRAPVPREPAYLEKISEGLWNQLPKAGNSWARVEIILSIAARDDDGWRAALQSVAPDLIVDGRLAQMVTAWVPFSELESLASLVIVDVIRSPATGRVDVAPGFAQSGNGAKALQAAGLEALHQKGYRGQGVRLALIDTDFRGWRRLLDAKRLPAHTHVVDLTAEANPDVLPMADGGSAEVLGHGTQCALAAALAAPEAELVLVRVAGDSPYQLAEIGDYLAGNVLSPSLMRRQGELATMQTLLNERSRFLISQRQIILDRFTDERDQEREFGFLGPVYGWIFSDRVWLEQQDADLRTQQRLLSERTVRYVALVEQIRSLKGITVVANPLDWHAGYPLGGSSPLSRWLDDVHPLLWFQPAGNTRGQAWAGLFRDNQSSGLLAFAAPDTPLPAGHWSRELNFLGWQPWNAEPQADVPAQMRVRIALQWREAQDPALYPKPGEDDLYRNPLTPLTLTLLRQRDPQAKTLPADSFDVVARSSSPPERLEFQPGSAVYEQILEVTLPEAGRYALQVEKSPSSAWVLVNETGPKAKLIQLTGLVATDLKPLGVPTLSNNAKKGELQVRLFVDAAEQSARRKGRVLFSDFFTDVGTVGAPADARSIITVGAADPMGQPRSFSARGGPAFSELAHKPSLLAPDALFAEPINGGAYGTSVSNAFTAGTAATMLSRGWTMDQVAEFMRGQNGGLLRIVER